MGLSGALPADHFAYDAAGNRIKTGGAFARTTIPPALSTVSYNANNQQTTFGTNTETYDLNGNLSTVTDAGVTAMYTWNARNQLTSISTTGFTASFTYDSFGRQTGRTVQGVTTNFVYDGLNPVQEKAGATVTANLLTGLGIDEFFTRTDGVGSRALLPDALGSTVALGDGTGTLQTQYTYEPFGSATQTGLTSLSSYKYTGREDDGTGLYYYRARYYHPRLQRFIAEDPIGFAGGDMNIYAYVGNNPHRWIDPTGLDSTNWDNTAGGRSRWDGPTNGNWGGKCWSGGQYSCGSNPSGHAQPLDSGDQCYKRHDDCYTICRDNKQCLSVCDQQLRQELNDLPSDPKSWPDPPRRWTDRDSNRYKDMARWWFRERK